MPLYGWAGKILNVDLTTGKIETEALDKDWAKKYIGGNGFGARILYDEVGPEVDPLSPENIAVITQGPLAGTLAPASGRCEVVAKSPMTGILARSNVGGNFGPEMKWAGYDIITIRGKSEKPVYLWIAGDHVELRDASHLWGKDVWEAQPIIADELKDTVADKHYHANIATLLIGPAGEHLALTSCIMCGPSRSVAAGSIGAVWGSKNLKGIAIWGNKGVNLARPAEFLQVCKTLRENFKDDPLYETVREWGTISWVGGAYSRSPAGKAMSGGVRNEAIEESGFKPLVERSLACHGCPLHCSHFLNVKEGKYAGTKGEGLEGFVQILALIWKTPSAAFLTKYNNMCNQLGLSNSAVGPAISWAMALWKAGIITEEDTDGIKVTEGNEDAILELTQKIAYRDGFGEILADYPLRSARKVGKGSDMYATHNKGMHAYGFNPGIATTLEYTLAHNVATRGFDHLTGGPSIYAPNMRDEWGITTELLTKLGQERYGDPEIFTDVWGGKPQKAKVVYDYENMMIMADMTGLCKFVTRFNLVISGMDLAPMGELLTAATGEVFTTEDMVKAAERQFALERAYNAREGIRRIDDYPFFLWWQLKHGEANPLFNYEEVPVKLENYDVVLDEYYKLRGCDLKTGIPTRETLERLGLKDVADDLENRQIVAEE